MRSFSSSSPRATLSIHERPTRPLLNADTLPWLRILVCCVAMIIVWRPPYAWGGASSSASGTVTDSLERPLPDAEVKVRVLPGGRYATLMLKGPYAQLNAAYAALFAWLEGGGRTRGDGPIVEVYFNDPHDTAPADLETEIRLPLA